jgi:hypothetical protein
MQAGIAELDERIRIGYLQCFLLIVTEYRTVVLSHNWITPLPKPGIIYDDQSSGHALASHIEWLSSVANDCQHILDRHIQACVEIDFDDEDMPEERLQQRQQRLGLGHRGGESGRNSSRKESITMTAQNAMELNQSMYQLTKLLSSVIGTAIDALSCIMFKSIIECLPTTNIFQQWRLQAETLSPERGEGGQQQPEEASLVEGLLDALDSYLEEDFFCVHSKGQNTLEVRCLEKLVDICLKKVLVWYLTMLRECSSSNVTLNEAHLTQVSRDCALITQYFQSKLVDLQTISTNQSSNSDRQQHHNEYKYQKIETQLLIFETINRLLNEPFGSHLFLKTCMDLLELSTHEKCKAYSYRQLVLVLLKIRGRKGKKRPDNGQDDDQGEDSSDILVDVDALTKGVLESFEKVVKESGGGSGTNIVLPSLYMVEPPAEILVFQFQTTVEKYLISSTAQRSKKEQELLTKEFQQRLEMSGSHESTQTSSSSISSASTSHGVEQSMKLSFPKALHFTDLFRGTKQKEDEMSLSSTHHSFPSLFHFQSSTATSAPPSQATVEEVFSLSFQQIEVKNLYELDRPTSVYLAITSSSHPSSKYETPTLANQSNHLLWEPPALSSSGHLVMTRGAGEAGEAQTLTCVLYYKFKFRFLPLKVGVARITLREEELLSAGEITLVDEPFQCNEEVGTAKEILMTQKMEDKHRQPPLLSLVVRVDKSSPSGQR